MGAAQSARARAGGKEGGDDGQPQFVDYYELLSVSGGWGDASEFPGAQCAPFICAGRDHGNFR